MEWGVFGMLVLSGHFAPSLGQYNFISEPKTWQEAQQYCREECTDLATINDVLDLEALAGLVDSIVTLAFVGLYRGWGWSLTDTDDNKEGEPAYWNWASGEPKEQLCGSIGPTGEWFATNCSSRLSFFCYNGFTAGSQRFIWVNRYMDWFHAQAYCRTWHTDLARVRNQLENDELLGMENNGSRWIGLTGNIWMWSDGSETSFIPWEMNQPQLSGLSDCGVLDVNSNPRGLTDMSCDEKLPFFCYTDPQSALSLLYHGLRLPQIKHIVGLKLTPSDSSVNMTDSAVMDSILKWVQGRLSDSGASEGVTLSWTKAPEKEKNRRQEQTETLVCVP